jgi:hypothetical protein
MEGVMSKLLRLSALSALIVLAAGCAGVTWKAPVIPPRGVLFTQYKAPMTAEFNETDVSGLRSGSTSTLYVRDPFVTGQGFAWEDASIQSAAKKAGITKIHYADYEMLEVLTIFGRFTVTVHGE